MTINLTIKQLIKMADFAGLSVEVPEGTDENDEFILAC